MTNLKLLLLLFWRPAAAMSGILDQGSLLFASLAALCGSLAAGAGPLDFGFYLPLLVLAAVYVPGTLLLTNLFARLGGLGMVLQRDYSSLLTCAAMSWAAVNLPLALARFAAPLPVFAVIAGLALLYFAVLMFLAVRTVFGIDGRMAAAVVSLSWIPLVAVVFLWGPFHFILGWVASPFFLLFAYYYLGSELRGLGSGLRRGQHLRRMLEVSTINPHDGEAQYQLGLIYQQRHRYTEAIQRFQRAVAIDPGETDAHFQLGRIARRQGRLKDALGYFQTVVNQDENHCLNEILRELGAVYVGAKQYQDARHELEMYVERRPYDPEGLYYYGQALEGLGDPAGARAAYARALEAARTAPRYRRRFTAEWSRLAAKQLKKVR